MKFKMKEEAWKRSNRSYTYQSPEPKPQQRRREVQFAHQYGTSSSRRKWRQTGQGGGWGLVITVSHNHCLTQCPQKHRRDVGTEEADRCVSKIFSGLKFISWVLSVEMTVYSTSAVSCQLKVLINFNEVIKI